MDERKVIQSFNFTTIFKYFTLTNTFVLAVLVITSTSLSTCLIVLGLVNVYYIASLTLKRLPIKILVDKKLNILIIESLRYLVRREIKEYNINEVTYSYKEEMRARGIIVKTLRIKNASGKSILELIPNYNGWSEAKLKNIFETLQSSSPEG